MASKLISGQDGKQRHTRIWLVASCFLVFATAATLRIGFVQTTLNQYADLPASMQASNAYGFMARDSAGYLLPADRIAAGELLHAGSLKRPPVYPMFLWICGRSPDIVLILQALLGSLIPVCTLLLSHHLLRNLPISIAAGLVSAVSPTGIGVTGLIMADLLLAVLFAVGLCVLFQGSTRQSIGWVLVPALLFGVAGLVKPILLFWPLLSAFVWWLFKRAEQRRVRWTQVLVLVLVQASFFVAWASCNYVRDNVFTVSEIGLHTVRCYWATQVEEWARAGHRPSGESIQQNRAAVIRRLEEIAPPERIRTYKEESIRIFKKYPELTISVFLYNISRLSVGGWNRFHRQVPLDTSLLSRLEILRKVESVARRYGRWLIMPGFVLMLIVARVWRTPDNRRISLGICGLSVAYLYVTACTGITMWTGTRVVYLIESIAITIVAAEVDLLVRAGNSWRRSRPGAARSTTTAT
jgi:hypothetical protein